MRIVQASIPLPFVLLLHSQYMQRKLHILAFWGFLVDLRDPLRGKRALRVLGWHAEPATRVGGIEEEVQESGSHLGNARRRRQSALIQEAPSRSALYAVEDANTSYPDVLEARQSMRDVPIASVVLVMA